MKRVFMAGLYLIAAIGICAAETILFQENFDGLSSTLKPAVNESIPSSILGWTHTPPDGWSIDNTQMGNVVGMQEWQGWSFVTMNFWLGADSQLRGDFTRGKNVFAVADPDEWDDRNSPSATGRFNSLLQSPPIPVSANQQLYLHFDSHYRQEAPQRAQVRVSFNGGEDTILLNYHSGSDADNAGQDVVNSQLVLPLPVPPTNGTMVLKWHLFNAGNNWYWAIDHIKVSDVGPPPPPTPTPKPVPIVTKGPYVQFLDESTVTVHWETQNAGTSIVEYGTDDLDHRVEDTAPKTAHHLTISGLIPGTDYRYAIKTSIGNGELLGGYYSFDSTFESVKTDWNSIESPYPVDDLTPVYEAAAQTIAAHTGSDKGYCLVWGFGEGRLAFEIAKRTSLKIIGIEEDPAAIAKARTYLNQAGLYGDRISVQHGSLAQPPYRNYFANLVVSDRLLTEGTIQGSAAEMFRCLRPCGGTIVLGQPGGVSQALDRDALESWLLAGGINDYSELNTDDGIWLECVRAPLEGSGEWTHQYAEPGNTACSQDQLVQSPLKMLWYGRPGPRLIINRHSRPMASLYKNGRIFIPADDRIIALDAYNGTRLWDLSVPGSRRLGAFKGSAQMALTEEYIYIVQGRQCHAVDVLTGLPAMTFTTPLSLPEHANEWGYVSCVGDWLYGTGHTPNTPFYEYTSNGNCDVLEGDYRACMVSDSIFGQNRFTGESLWIYQNGAILESSISVGDGRVYFAENRNLPAPKGIWEGPGRRWVGNFTAGNNTYLVALNAQDGSLIWEQQVNLPFTEMMYLSFAQTSVLTVGTFNRNGNCYYGLFAYDASTGKPKWNREYNSGKGIDGSHGEQWQHPVILGNKIVSMPNDYDLETGAKGTFQISKSSGCGTFSASAGYLFARDSNPTFFKYNSSQRGKLCSVTRPGCFINIIPAGGMVIIPESSSGCTCEYSVQSSMAFIAAR